MRQWISFQVTAYIVEETSSCIYQSSTQLLRESENGLVAWDPSHKSQTSAYWSKSHFSLKIRSAFHYKTIRMIEGPILSSTDAAPRYLEEASLTSHPPQGVMHSPLAWLHHCQKTGLDWVLNDLIMSPHSPKLTSHSPKLTPQNYPVCGVRRRWGRLKWEGNMCIGDRSQYPVPASRYHALSAI